MIIKPFEKSELQLPINKVYTDHDEWGNEYSDIIRRISINSSIDDGVENSIGRMERLSLARDPYHDESVIFKESAIGYITPKGYSGGEYDKELLFDSYAYSSLDSHDGSYIQSGGYCNLTSSRDFVAFGNLYDMPIESILFPNESKSYKTRALSSLEHTPLNEILMDVEVQIFENEYQLPYTETIGLLNVFFSTWTYGYPFETIVVIDCKRKEFNIPKIIYFPLISKDMIRNIYVKFIQEVDKISNYIFRITEQEKRNIKFLIFLHPFGTMVKIKDLDRNTIDNVKTYNSNQPVALMKNVKAGGLKYISGESFGLLRKGQFEEPVMQALECSDIFY